MNRILKIGLLLAALVLFARTAPSAVVFNFGSSWKYFIGTQEPSVPMDAWRGTNFNDSTWQTGTAAIGYAVPPNDPAGWEAAIVTTLPTSTASNYLTVYFRRPFVVTNKAAITQLTLSLRIDDGYVVWINGTSVGTNNAPASPWPFDVGTGTAVTEGTEFAVPFPPSLVVNGTNVVAIQVFQAGTGSSDLLMDAALTSDVDDQPPVVLAVEPTPDSTVLQLNSIHVTFDDVVTGVDASDLLINGSPATNLTFFPSREYTFSFPTPATGLVQVAWAQNHGITDTSSLSNAFAGGSWSYTYDPNAPERPNLIISEFMADNEHGIEDEDGAKSDWIEIQNLGPTDANLDGWFLTDTPLNLRQWRFPSVSLLANKYLLVWASEKNRTNPAAPLHTNFKLEKNGEYLALVDPQTNIVSAFGSFSTNNPPIVTNYPVQFTDISYGRAAGDPNIVGYFATPTPGAQNSSQGTGFGIEPGFSLDSGVYTNNSLTLSITVPPGTTVRYAFGGAVPTATSTAYSGPITFTTNMTIKARAFPSSAGVFPSAVVSRTFVMVDTNLANFNSNLPLLIISTEGKSISANLPPGSARTKGTLVVIDAFRGRSSWQAPADFQGLAEFEVFGQTSAGFAKQPFNIEIQDELSNDRAMSLLGMPSEADWKLRNPWTDKFLMGDFLAYEMFEKMGHYSVRRRFVEVFVDTGGTGSNGKLGTNDYYGIEVLLEKIERGNDRVDIAELTPYQTNEPAITGGWILKYDKNSTGDWDINTLGGGGFARIGGDPVNEGRGLKIHEPKVTELRTPVGTNQVRWLTNWLNSMERALYAATWLTATGSNHWSYYIDADSFVDQHWIVEFPKQIDGYRLSNYMHKDRNGKLKMEPIWDWNLAFGNANYLDGGHTNNWYYTQAGEKDHPWLRRLMNGTTGGTGTAGDPNFNQKISDRWSVLRTNVMNGSNLLARIDELAAYLSEAAARNYQKYAILGRYDWPNPDGNNTTSADNSTAVWDIDYVTPTNYAGIITQLKKWVGGRYNWIDSLFTTPPVFNHSGGMISNGFVLTIAAQAGAAIYYTLDGSDPRGSGGVTNGTAYAGPITINGNVRVVARARHSGGTATARPWNGTWGGPAEITLFTALPALRITEIMYHPAAPPAGSPYTDEDFEYLELKNIGGTPLNLNRFRISGGIDFEFPNISLPAGSNIVVVANLSAFQSRYGTNSVQIAGVYSNRLDNAGERLILEGPVREPILDFSYEDDWYPITDGNGFSLVIVNENAPLSSWGEKASWRPSGAANGSPGVNDPAPPGIQQVVINEALTHTDLPIVDTIELYNPSASPVDIGGWYLTDDFNTPKKYRITNGTMIAAGGFLTFNENQFNVGGGGNTAFSLSSLGDQVYLFSGNAGGNLSGYFHGFQFDAQKNGVTFGRYVNSVSNEHFVAQTANTLNGPNAGPLIGPVVINEIMYRPPDVLANGSYWNNTEDEYIELYNRSGSPVSLFDPAHRTNTWKLDKAVEFQFPTNVTLSAGGYLLVVNFDPVRQPARLTAFRAKHNVGGSIPIFGPYGGDLSNGDETVALYMPDEPVLAGADAGKVPFVLVEEVRFSDEAPWPTAADGFGASLQRLVPSAYGNDPANWVAAARNPGGPYGGGAGAAITAHPTNQTVVAYMNTSFSVSATGPNLSYQWLFNGAVIDGAYGATLTLNNVQAFQAGEYRVVVINPAGAVFSSNATLTVLIPANITQHPTNVTLTGSTNFATYGYTTSNATFSVVANSATPMRFQWRHDGVAIQGATNASISLTNPTPANEGLYDVVITDSAGPVISIAARLRIIIPAIVYEQPLAATYAVVGENVVYTIGVTGSPPFGIRWRREGTPYIPFPGAPTITVSNVPLSWNSNKFTAVVTNAGTPGSGVISSNAFIFVLEDTDGDRMPDIWEMAFGLNHTNAMDGTNDLDGDTMINRDEWIAGTDPMDPESYLKVDDISVSGETTLAFIAISNKSYTIQYSDALASGLWSKLANVNARTNTRPEIVIDPNPSGGRYYRLITPRLP